MLHHSTTAFLLALAAPFRQAGAPSQDPTPRNTVRAAVAAVEGDSVDRVRRRWTAALAAAPTDRSSAFGLATLDRVTYRYREAEKRFQELIAARDDDRWAVAAWIGLGLAAFPHGSLLDAEARFTRALEVARKVGDRPLEIEALLGLATITARLTSTDSGLKLLAGVPATLPPDDRWLKAAYLCRRSGLEGNAGRPAARGLAAEGIELAQAVGDGRLEAGCRTAVAILHVQRGATDSAFREFTTAAARQMALRDWQGYAISLQWQGSVRASYGSLSLATKAIRFALQAADSSGNEAARGFALIALSTVSTSIRDFPSAETALAAAESIFRATGDQSGLLSAMTLRAQLELVQGDAEEAERLYREALPMAGRFYGTWRVSILRRLATLRTGRKEFAAADSILTVATGLADSLGLAGQLLGIEVDRSLTQLGAGKLAEARKALQSQLLRSSNYTPLTQHSQYLALAGIEMVEGRIASAESLVVKGTDALEVWRGRLTDEQLRVHTFAIADNQTAIQFATLMAGLIEGGRLGAAFDLIERRRARLLLDRLVGATATSSDSVALASVHKNRAEIGRPLTHTAVQAALPPRTALLLFATGADTAPTSLLVATRERLRGYRIAPAELLVPMVRRLTKLLESGVYPDSLASALGTSLLGGALAELDPSIDQLIVVADGPLHRLPFATIRVGAGPLLDRFAIVNAASATVAVRRPADTTVRTPAVLAFGDPSFATDRGPDAAAPARAFDNAGGLRRLAGTGTEAEWVGRYSAHSIVRLGRTASEAAFKQQDLTRFTVLHLATHAIVDDQSSARTALALAPGGGEDGFLTPADLATRRLGADLVVLSACRTARGVLVGGEGILGLTAPLLESGARAVVATLWPVDDRRTGEFVKLFYDEMALGAPVAKALQRAKVAARQAGFSPQEWASFELFGDGTTVVRLEPGRSRNRARWVLGVALFAATVALLAGARRRDA